MRRNCPYILYFKKKKSKKGEVEKKIKKKKIKKTNRKKKVQKHKVVTHFFWKFSSAYRSSPQSSNYSQPHNPVNFVGSFFIFSPLIFFFHQKKKLIFFGIFFFVTDYYYYYYCIKLVIGKRKRRADLNKTPPAGIIWGSSF